MLPSLGCVSGSIEELYTEASGTGSCIEPESGLVVSGQEEGEFVGETASWVRGFTVKWWKELFWNQMEVVVTHFECTKCH